MPGVLLLALLAVAPAKTRVFLDAGHGAGTNTGARTVHCTDEADFVLALAKDVKQVLERTGRFDVRLSRRTAKGPSYRRRLAAAERFGADVLVSLHVDTRGEYTWHEPKPGERCPVSREQPGFAILVSDEGGAKLVEARRRLARSVAKAMSGAGFVAYDGFDYGGLYLNDPVDGVFIDRRRLFMLRRPSMPSVIVETHHALIEAEHEQWKRPERRVAFARALGAALQRTVGARRPRNGQPEAEHSR